MPAADCILVDVLTHPILTSRAMRRFGGLVVLLCVVLQGWALSLSWPADGSIIAGTTIQISFSGGVTPYTLTVLGFNPRNADNQIQVFTGQTGDSIQWLVSVPDGYVRFNVTDASGGMIISYWQIVYPNQMVAVSSLSIASTFSTASAQSVQSYISQLSTSAQWATLTGSPGSQSAPTGAAETTTKSSNNTGAIVGGVLGGVAGLLAIALAVFWWIRRRYPVPEGDGTTQYTSAWNSDSQDKEGTTIQSQPILNPYQQVPVGSQSPSPIQATHHAQPQPMAGMYGGLPEIHGGAR